MGVQFDRIPDGFSGPFVKIDGLLPAPAGSVTGVSNPVGYLISHRVNDAFVVVNRLLKADCAVYWLMKPQSSYAKDLGTGPIWVPAAPAVRPILDHAAQQYGISAYGMAKAPSGQALKLQSIRIGLYDQYGGLMPSGWDRWLFEQYEFPFEVVYPQTLDAGDLKSRFDVLVLTDGAFRRGPAERGAGIFNARQPNAEEIPEQYRSWLGRISENKTLPQIQKFIEAGGSVVTIGSSTGLAELLGVPVENYLTQMGSDGKEHPLPRDKYYVPGSLLKVRIDNNNPLAYGMPDHADVFFENSPVFKLLPEAALKRTSAVAWFAGPKPLESGWAWGQQYLEGGTAVAEASIGEGKVFLFGPEVTFRGQPHGTFKLLFNGVYYGSAKPVTLQ
jgi:hypothetical protein